MLTVLVIGGSGAQGVAVIKALTANSKYMVRFLTRDNRSSPSTELSALPNVEIVVGNSYNEIDLRKHLKGAELAFVNTNGFAIGEKAEIFWGIRIFELARELGVKHFVWSNLDYAFKKGGYDPQFRCAHYDGKAKVADFISAQPTTPMGWSIFTSGPYMEMLSELMQPFPTADASPHFPKPGMPSDGSAPTLVYAAPLGDGAVAMIHLEDLGRYVRWIFDNPTRSIGMDLEIATEHVHFTDLAEVFSEVTGRKAVYKPISQDEYFGGPNWRRDPEVKVGHSMDHGDDTLQSFRQNFGGFWNIWKASGGNKGVVRRDYELLDEILPDRVKSVKEWMRKTGYKGEAKPVLKDISDLKKRAPPIQQTST